MTSTHLLSSYCVKVEFLSIQNFSFHIPIKIEVVRVLSQSSSGKEITKQGRGPAFNFKYHKKIVVDNMIE
jgi:hypothetical protein